MFLQLAHEVLRALQGTEQSWLVDLLYAFNSGIDIYSLLFLCSIMHCIFNACIFAEVNDIISALEKILQSKLIKGYSW